MGIDYWEEARVQALLRYNVDGHQEDQSYSTSLKGAPLEINVGEQRELMRAMGPFSVSPALDTLFHHARGPSPGNITEINGPRGIGKSMYW